jgi:hypothetical protein
VSLSDTAGRVRAPHRRLHAAAGVTGPCHGAVRRGCQCGSTAPGRAGVGNKATPAYPAPRTGTYPPRATCPLNLNAGNLKLGPGGSDEGSGS